jgi:hypothetical protein
MGGQFPIHIAHRDHYSVSLINFSRLETSFRRESYLIGGLMDGVAWRRRRTGTLCPMSGTAVLDYDNDPEIVDRDSL